MALGSRLDYMYLIGNPYTSMDMHLSTHSPARRRESGVLGLLGTGKRPLQFSTPGWCLLVKAYWEYRISGGLHAAVGAGCGASPMVLWRNTFAPEKLQLAKRIYFADVPHI